MNRQIGIKNKENHLLQGMLAMFALCGFLILFTLKAVAAPGVVSTSNVNVRAAADATSEAVGAVNENDKVDILAEEIGADGKIWYKVKLTNGVTGYIRSDFVTKVIDDNQDEEQEPEQTTTVTPVTAKKGYVKGRTPVNIRKQASTTSAKVATAEGGSELKIVGEATGTDGKKWYQVEFSGNGTTMKGFVRSDLLDFNAPEQEPEEVEIGGELGEPQSSEEVSEQISEEPPMPSEEPKTEDSATVAELTLLEPESTLENIPLGFEQIAIELGDNSITAWAKNDYYIFYAAKGDEEPQWYLFDRTIKGYVKYNGLFTNQNVTIVEKTPIFNWLSFVLIAVIAVLAGVVIFLIFKISQNKGDFEEYEGYDDDEDNDSESDFDMEMDDDEDDIPVRHEMNYINQRPMENKTIEPKTLIMPAPELPVETVAEPDDEEDEDMEEMDDIEEEADDVEEQKPRKKGFGQKLLDYFTTEVDDDEDEDDEDEDEEEDEQMSFESSSDDDDDDLNFIDL